MMAVGTISGICKGVREEVQLKAICHETRNTSSAAVIWRDKRAVVEKGGSFAEVSDGTTIGVVKGKT